MLHRSLPLVVALAAAGCAPGTEEPGSVGYVLLDREARRRRPALAGQVGRRARAPGRARRRRARRLLGQRRPRGVRAPARDARPRPRRRGSDRVAPHARGRERRAPPGVRPPTTPRPIWRSASRAGSRAATTGSSPSRRRTSSTADPSSGCRMGSWRSRPSRLAEAEGGGQPGVGRRAVLGRRPRPGMAVRGAPRRRGRAAGDARRRLHLRGQRADPRRGRGLRARRRLLRRPRRPRALPHRRRPGRAGRGRDDHGARAGAGGAARFRREAASRR